MNADAVASLVGIPYVPRGRTLAGADCWGVVLLAARRLWGVELPEYFYTEAQLLQQAQRLIAEEVRGPRWRLIEHDPFPPGSVHIFRMRGAEAHCGVHLWDTWFLHSLAGRNSCVESLTDLHWRHCRVATYVYVQ